MIQGSRKERHSNKKVTKYKLKSAIALLISFILLLSIGFSTYLVYLAYTIDDVVLQGNLYPSGVYSKSDTPIGIIGGGATEYVALSEISPHFVNAVISVEDNDFYSHPGINITGIARAMYVNIRNRRIVQGGSTITQQLAKNIFLTHERTLDRKLKELVYTFKLERSYSKDEILEAYLNNIYYGHGNYGIKAASNYYFRKEPSEMTLDEAALLAGIIQGPYLYTPFRDANIVARDELVGNEELQTTFSGKVLDTSYPAGSLVLPSTSRTFTRRSFVLNRMVQEGYITSEQASEARERPVPFKEPEETTGTIHLPLLISKELEQIELKMGLEEGELRVAHNIYTTIDENAQLVAQQIISDFRNYLPEAVKQKEGISSAIVAVDPSSGTVLAMAGRHATWGVPKPGSSFKPIVYALALESQKFTLINQYHCTNIQGFDPQQPGYNPSDFSSVPGQQRFHNEDLTMRRAIRESCNIYALLTNRDLGPDNVRTFAKHLGYGGKLDAGTAMALGTSGVNMIDMAAIYSVFANGGVQVEPYIIEEIRDRFGNVIYRRPPQLNRRLITEETSFLITDALRDVLRAEGGTARSASHLIPSRDAAVKTGSTSDYAYIAGYTPEIVSIAYVGYDTAPPNANLGVTGGRFSPLWANFTNKALDQMLGQGVGGTFTAPPGIVQKHLCSDTLLLATTSCPNKFSEYFTSGTGPEQYCNVHQDSSRARSICTDSWKLATDFCPSDTVRRFIYQPWHEIPTEGCDIHTGVHWPIP